MEVFESRKDVELKSPQCRVPGFHDLHHTFGTRLVDAGYRYGEATTLNNICSICDLAGEKLKALEYLTLH